ncbi:hypothetical protein D9757_009590 [Collybiopsis confluens]|uniref:Glycosyltransferase 2-like domain-containing protein n=1 Tax=Collybiopsis confluens TaxID=2823264 RepID=A0A8H5M0Y8_9AGAR|nr:hypothetical protein D9757_009590 [Collybiopsis confluens]
MATPNQVHWQAKNRPAIPSPLNLTSVSDTSSSSYLNSPSHSLTILNNDYDAFDAILHNIYEKTLQDNWFKPASDADTTGVCIRVDSSAFRCFPYENPNLIPFERGVRRLNVEAAVKIRSASVHAAVSGVPASATDILLDSNTRIQILPDIDSLGDAEREQCAAFIRADHTLVVWAFSVDQVIPLWNELEEKLIKYIWRTRSAPRRESNTPGLFDPLASPPVRDNTVLPDVGGASGSGALSIPTSAYPSTAALPEYFSSGASTPAVVIGPFGMEDVDRSAAVNLNFNFGFGALEDKEEQHDEKPVQKKKKKKKSKFWSFLSWWRIETPDASSPSDLEEGSESQPQSRQLVLLGPFYAGCGAALAVYFAAAGVSNLVEEWVLDGDSRRFGLVVILPIVAAVSIFFCLQLVGNLSLVLGPVAQYHENSAYYSAQRPRPNAKVDGAARWTETVEKTVIRGNDGQAEEVEREIKKEVRVGGLPHITIQCPVYKESLELTITPSVLSIKKAMQTYARQGGTSSIFICDDGLQIIPEEDRQQRLEFYSNHNIGWVARPKHDSSPGGFKRAGKFKKASNMNYGLALSVAMEQQLARLIVEASSSSPSSSTPPSPPPTPGFQPPSHDSTPSSSSSQLRFENLESLEERALQLAIEQIYQESGTVKKVVDDETGKEVDKVVLHKPWAGNPRSLKVGEIILIIDADTVVPEDCFRDAAREMGEEGGESVAIIQHESDVMQVAHHYFENGITHFTRRINKCISYGCANGEVAPFVGHNAFLRWKAVQDASFIDEADKKRKFWSEANVSEDFDLALRLLLKGYTLRWATYSQGGFKEGVSLTVVDELARWQKYAYGCDEIIFNPLIQWWRKGPISKQLREFMQSSAPIHYKIGMSSYMFSYYGMAAATVGGVLNYLLLGLGPDLDRFYLHSFEILLACVVVFPALGNLGFTLLEYRLGHRSIWGATYENLRWIPFFSFFFGGLSIHLSTAILAHLFSYDMTWGSTGKEIDDHHLPFDHRNDGHLHDKCRPVRMANSWLELGIEGLPDAGGSIGTGLFVGSGAALKTGGPAGVLIGWLIIGVMLINVTQAIGEMAILYPVSGGFYTLAYRFLDPGFAFAMGWNYFLQWAVVLPLEITVAGTTVNYWTDKVPIAAWITVFWVVIMIICLFGTLGYAEEEFWASCLKLLIVVMFVFIGVICICGGGPTGGEYDHYIGGSFWQDPGAFAHGFQGVCAVFVTAAFAFSGTEIVGLAASETPNPRATVPAAVKASEIKGKTLIYITSLTIIGLLIPWDDERLLGGTSAAASPFVITLVNAKIPGLNHLVNATICISVISIGLSCVYAGSRTLTALAETGYAPSFFTYIDKSSRPLFSVIAVLLFAPIAYVNVVAAGDIVFAWLVAISGLSTLVTWGSICLCHIRFRRAWKVQGHSLEELPFKALGGAWGSWLGLILVILVLIAQFYVGLFPVGGVPNASERVQNFFQAYLAAPIVLAFWIIGYLWKRTTPWRAHQIDLDTGRKSWLTVEEMRKFRAERRAAPMYVRVYRMLFSN